MPLRAQYVANVGIDRNTYPNNAGPRVAGMYQTARRGRIAQTLTMRIWGILYPIYEQALAGRLPTDQPAYDQFVVRNAIAIQDILQDANRGGFGIGQKIVNLFMKDLWGLGVVVLPTESLLHAPLDRIVLTKCQNPPATWNAWSRVAAAGPGAPEVSDYLKVQQHIRNFHAACPIAFPSVIQMEQFIWHKM